MSYEDSDHGFQLYLRQIAQYPLLTPAQEITLAAKIKKGNKAAKAEMIRANLRLVVKIARDYANLGLGNHHQRHSRSLHGAPCGH